MTDHETPEGPLRVSRRTDSGKLGKSIAYTLRERENGRVRIRAMGPEAVNNSVKGLIQAQARLAAMNQDLAYRAHFETTVEGGEEINLIVFTAWLYE